MFEIVPLTELLYELFLRDLTWIWQVGFRIGSQDNFTEYEFVLCIEESTRIKSLAPDKIPIG